MGKPVIVTEQTFAGEVLQSDVPVLADFWAEWCAPCRRVAPVVEAVADAYQGRLKVVKVDVDANPALAARFNVHSIPTLAFFEDGVLFERIVGYVPESELKGHIDAALDSRVAQPVADI